MSLPAAAISYADALNCYKRAFLRAVLSAHGGNQCRAAKELGVHRNTLSRQCAALGVDWKEFAPQGSAGGINDEVGLDNRVSVGASSALSPARRATFAPKSRDEARRTA